MRIATPCFAAALFALGLATPAMAQSTPIPEGVEREIAVVGRDFWKRARPRVMAWAKEGSPSLSSIRDSTGRQQIGGVGGRRAHMRWRRHLDRRDGYVAICDASGRDVFYEKAGEMVVTYQTVDESGGGSGSFYNSSNTQRIGYRARTPLELSFSPTGMTVRVERAVGVDFDRDYDILDRYSRAFRSGMVRLSPITIRFNESERTAYERDPHSFEWGLHIGGIPNRC